MFTCKEIDFKRLCTLEKEKYIESMIYLYEKNEYRRFEIFYKKYPIGFLILAKDKDNIYIAYFQIYKSKRRIGLGKMFILQFINWLKAIECVSRIYLTSLYESIPFWIKCGFINDNKCKDTMYYKL